MSKVPAILHVLVGAEAVGRLFAGVARRLGQQLDMPWSGPLFVNGLPDFTQKWFLFWNAVGLVVYFSYSMRKSNLARAQKPQGS